MHSTSGDPSVSESKKVFIQFAMRIEAEPLLSLLGSKKIIPSWSEHTAFEFYDAKFENLELIIGLAGVDPVHAFDAVGTVPAALLAHLSVTHYSPDLVLNAGTCGGFQERGHQLAQVFIGTRHVVFHHRRSSLPAMRSYGIGQYPVARSEKLRLALELPEGTVSSGDALDYSKEDAEYMSENGGTLKEMEAAAIGWVCSFSQTPFLPVKSITDFVDHPADTGEQFMKNYGVAVTKLTGEVMRILSYLSKNGKDPVWQR